MPEFLTDVQELPPKRTRRDGRTGQFNGYQLRLQRMAQCKSEYKVISDREGMQGPQFHGDFGGRQIDMPILEWSWRLHNHNLLPAHRRKILRAISSRSEFPDCDMSVPIALDRMNWNIDDACIFLLACQNPGSQPTHTTSCFSAKSTVGYLRVRSQP